MVKKIKSLDLSALRERTGLKLEKIAEKTSFSRTSLTNFEARNTLTKSSRCQEISEALREIADDILEEADYIEDNFLVNSD